MEKIRQQDKDAKETHYLAAQIAMAEKQPDSALKELEAALNKEPQQGIDLLRYGSGPYVQEGLSRGGEQHFGKRWRSIPSFTARV